MLLAIQLLLFIGLKYSIANLLKLESHEWHVTILFEVGLYKGDHLIRDLEVE